MNNEPEESGEMINDATLMSGGEDGPVEIHKEPVFIPKAWRGKLGIPDDGQMHD